MLPTCLQPFAKMMSGGEIQNILASHQKAGWWRWTALAPVCITVVHLHRSGLHVFVSCMLLVFLSMPRSQMCYIIAITTMMRN
jgi:hypothetical protein